MHQIYMISPSLKEIYPLTSEKEGEKKFIHWESLKNYLADPQKNCIRTTPLQIRSVVSEEFRSQISVYIDKET